MSVIPGDGRGVGSDNWDHQTKPRPLMELMREVPQRTETSSVQPELGKGRAGGWGEIQNERALNWSFMGAWNELFSNPVPHRVPRHTNPVPRGSYFELFSNVFLYLTLFFQISCFHLFLHFFSNCRCGLLIFYCGGLRFGSLRPPHNLPKIFHTGEKRRNIVTDPRCLQDSRGVLWITSCL